MARQEKLESKLYYKHRRQLRLDRESERTKLLVGNEAKAEFNASLNMEDTPEKDCEKDDFAVPKTTKYKGNPSIPVRIGYRSVDPRICQLLVDLESKFGIEARRSRKEGSPQSSERMG